MFETLTKKRKKVKVTVEVDEPVTEPKEVKDKNDNTKLIETKESGVLDMVIAFDTTGSMSAYIEDVKKHVKELIPTLLNTNPDLQLSIVAFGDYCDMLNAVNFGPAYQVIPLTRDGNALVDFVQTAKNTSGGDSDEFYELVLHKILNETKWREGAKKSILLIADAQPHKPGYTYKKLLGTKYKYEPSEGDVLEAIKGADSLESVRELLNNQPDEKQQYETIVEDAQYDWKQEMAHAIEMSVEIDTLSLCFYGEDWYKELSERTNGVYSQFKSSHKTSEFIKAAAWGRGGDYTSTCLYDMAYNSDSELAYSATAYMCKNTNAKMMYDKDLEDSKTTTPDD